MRRRVATPGNRSEVNSLDLPLIGAAPASQAAVNSEDGDWILPILMGALDDTMPRKEAALVMGMDAAQLTRQGSGDGHLSVRRLGLLGDIYWRNVVTRLQIHFGILSKSDLIDQANAHVDRARQLYAKAASL
jgi:hypothetical protein